ncbi:sodium:solute symporter family protein [Candidatus Sumerlaeota bacterium]|nr:sodium:solute symporter family protein [Candidatus Sumerlaeota bacterium]
MEGMLFLTILVVIYLFLIGYLGYRGWKGTKSATDYMVAGRKIHPFVMAMSYGATFISTSAIVGFGGAAALFGMSILWLTFLNIFVGIFIAFVFLGARTRKMGHHLDAHTFPELLGKRLDSKFVQIFTGLIIIVFMPLYAGVVLMGAARFIEVRIGVSYDAALFFFAVIVAIYVIMGGLKGVMYTDALQGTIMFVGMFLLLILTYVKLGGVTQAHQSLTDMAPIAQEIFGGAGHRGWTAMPTFGSTFWWVVISTIVMGVGIGVLAQPQLAVRYMTVKSDRELNRAVLIGGIFILMMTGVAFVVGALSNVFFYTMPVEGVESKIAFLAADTKVGQIIPLFMSRYMPPMLVDFFFIALLAAAMSTVSSQFHAMGTAVGRDVYETITRRKGESSILPTRLGILLTFILSVTLAYVLVVIYGETGTAIIARGTAIFFGLCASAFLPMYVGALYSRAITKAGAIWGACTGFIVSAFWLLFMHQTESSVLGVCNALFGKPSLVAGELLDNGKWSGVRQGFILWQEVDPLFVAFPLAIIVTIVVSMMTKRYSKDHLDHCFKGI